MADSNSTELADQRSTAVNQGEIFSSNHTQTGQRHGHDTTPTKDISQLDTPEDSAKTAPGIKVLKPHQINLSKTCDDEMFKNIPIVDRDIRMEAVDGQEDSFVYKRRESPTSERNTDAPNKELIRMLQAKKPDKIVKYEAVCVYDDKHKKSDVRDPNRTAKSYVENFICNLDVEDYTIADGTASRAVMDKEIITEEIVVDDANLMDERAVIEVGNDIEVRTSDLSPDDCEAPTKDIIDLTDDIAVTSSFNETACGIRAVSTVGSSDAGRDAGLNTPTDVKGNIVVLPNAEIDRSVDDKPILPILVF